MKYKLDLRSNEALYLQLARQIRSSLSKGELIAGDQLPTVRQLAQETGVNFNTVSRAYRVLEGEGFVITRQGRGTFVWKIPSRENIENAQKQNLEILTRRYFQAVTRLASSPEEVAAIVVKYLQAWKELGPPPGSEKQVTDETMSIEDVNR